MGDFWEYCTCFILVYKICYAPAFVISLHGCFLVSYRNVTLWHHRKLPMCFTSVRLAMQWEVFVDDVIADRCPWLTDPRVTSRDLANDESISRTAARAWSLVTGSGWVDHPRSQLVTADKSTLWVRPSRRTLSHCSDQVTLPSLNSRLIPLHVNTWLIAVHC